MPGSNHGIVLRHQIAKALIRRTVADDIADHGCGDIEPLRFKDCGAVGHLLDAVDLSRCQSEDDTVFVGVGEPSPVISV